MYCTLSIYSSAYATDGTPSLIGIFGGGFHILFAALLWVQTSRVRCVFEKDGFEFYNIKGPGLDLNKGAKLVRKPDNYVSATRNRWKYDKIINYGKPTVFTRRHFMTVVHEHTHIHTLSLNVYVLPFSCARVNKKGFYPSLEFPVICYFKETETPKKQWNRWFAAFDYYNTRGQPHFFPGICNARQFKEQMELRGVKRQ